MGDCLACSLQISLAAPLFCYGQEYIENNLLRFKSSTYDATDNSRGSQLFGILEIAEHWRMTVKEI